MQNITATALSTVFANVQQVNVKSTNTTAYFCVQQAQQQNNANAHKYTAQQRAFANNFYSMCASAFIRSKCYINLRNNYISVTARNVTTACLASNAVAQLAQYCTQHNITVKRTQNAVVFNIKF